MARINVEKEWFLDGRRHSLANDLPGGLHQADGLAIEAWAVSQEYWGHGRRAIPEARFKKISNFELLIKHGLARKVRGHFYVNGTRQFHEWYAQRVASSAKGGKSKGKEVKQNASKREANAKPLTSYLLPLNSNQKTETKGTTNVVAPQPTGLSPVIGKQNDTARFIGTYVKSYQGRYGSNTRPEIDGKAAGIAKTLVASIGVDRACELVQVYMQLDDKWFQTKSYDLGTFKENLNKIALAHSTGLQPKDIEAKKAEDDKWKKFREAVENES